jgi:hypothetical protein
MSVNKNVTTPDGRSPGDTCTGCHTASVDRGNPANFRDADLPVKQQARAALLGRLLDLRLDAERNCPEAAITLS